MAFFFNHLIDCWVKLYNNSIPVSPPFSYCYGRKPLFGKRHTTFIHFWKMPKKCAGARSHWRHNIREGSISLSLSTLFFPFNTSSIPVGKGCLAWPRIDWRNQAKMIWEEGQSNHGVYGRNWYANSFLLLFFFTQNAIEANQKFFCTFQIELFVMIMHNLAILFIAKQYSCFYYSKWVSRNNNRRGSFKSQNDWQYQWREREIALFI